MCNCRITATYFLIVLVHNIKFKGTGGGNYWKVVILTKRLIAQIYIHQAVYAWALEEIEWQSCFPQHKIKIDLLLFYDFCEVFFNFFQLNKASTNSTTFILGRKLTYRRSFFKNCLF